MSEDNTFVDASVRTCILNLTNSYSENYKVEFKKITNNINKTIETIKNYDKSFLIENIDNWLSIATINADYQEVIQKIKNNKVINDFFEVSQGYIPYRRSDLVKTFGEYGNDIVDKRLWHSDTKLDTDYKQEILGKNLFRYYNTETKSYIKYGKHLASYVLPKFFELPRVLIREITSKTLNCNYIEKEFYNNPSIINVIDEKKQLSLKYLLAILNSKLIAWYHNTTSPKAKKGLFPKILITDVRNIPIKQISKEAQQDFIEKADLMLSLHRELQTEKNNFLNTLKEEKNIEKITKKLDTFYDFEYDILKKELAKQKVRFALGDENNEWREYFNTTKLKINKLQNQINQTDKEIDKMVYELYELTPDEIEIVENSVK